MSIQNIGGPPGSSSAYVPTGNGVAQPGTAPAPAPAIDVVKAAAQPDTKQLKAAMDAIQKAVASRSSNLQFSFDDESNKTVVRVVDSDSGELIRQIPSEELMAIAKSIDRMQGMLLKQKA